MYVDALYFRNDNLIKVVERRNGERHLIDYPVNYTFYISDSNGNHLSIFQDKVKKVTPKSYKEYLQAKNVHSNRKIFESNVNYVFRCLEENYIGQEAPNMHVAFFDIETDFDKDIGYSSPEEASNPITSIAVYLQWIDQMVCLAVPPPTHTKEEAQKIADEVGDTIIFETEGEMLQTFLTLIDDADVLSGWNSESYDIPYTVNRIIKQLGKNEARKLCMWDQMPRKRYIKRGGKETQTYDLFGRVHSDYLQLYKKYNYEERHSYALDAIAKVELGEQKVPYDGTLDQLYKQDFKKFLEYNIQDTMLLDKLDKKLRYIYLASSIAHSNCVLMTTAMGTVSMVEQAITVEAHGRGMVVPDSVKVPKQQVNFGEESDGDEQERAAGGWVSKPKKGLHRWIGSSDLSSLYPSVIRCLNMSPETLIGQISTEGTDRAINEYIAEAKRHTFAEWWNDKFNTQEMDYFLDKDKEKKVNVHFQDGSSAKMTGAEIHRLIFESGEPWCISANGTIFRTDREGVIPSLLSRWYKERKELQSILRQINNIISEHIDSPYSKEEILIDDGVFNKPNVYDFRQDMLEGAFNTKDISVVTTFMNEWGLTITDNKKVVPHSNSLKIWKAASEYWDKQQLVKKINLNSAYGGLLNPHMKFFDQRIGQSTTLTGRSITKHMTAKTNEFLCGEYDAYGKCIIYNDTDSVYFSAWPEIKDEVDAGKLEWNKETAIDLYDTISKEVSKTFPQFMLSTFNVPLSRGSIIKSEREIVAETGLFIKKKRYACLVYDKEGDRKDLHGKRGSIKAMGLDLRRSDTPKYMQDFMMGILQDVLDDQNEEYVLDKIRSFKEEFENRKPWEKGMPKAVNNLTSYQEREAAHMKAKAAGEAKGGFTVPGHVRASLNWNRLREVYRDYHTGKIVDGQKVVVCYLKPNPENMTNIAYPVDELHLPNWFIELPFDEDEMMKKLVDQKIRNLLGVLKWDLSKTSKEEAHFGTLFEF